MKKAPVLSEEQVIEWIKANYGENAIIAPMAHGKPAQRDADHEYYEQVTRKIATIIDNNFETNYKSHIGQSAVHTLSKVKEFLQSLSEAKGFYEPPSEQIEMLKEKQSELMKKLSDVELAIQQAKTETIGEVKTVIEKDGPLTVDESYALWLKYEARHPLHDISWEAMLLQAQVQKILSLL